MGGFQTRPIYIGADDNPPLRQLFNDLRYNTGTYGSTTFTNSKPQLLLHRDLFMKFNIHRDIITRHHHLYTFW